MPLPLRFVRSTAAGDWFLPVDGGVGSLLRVAEGVAAGAVRRIRDLGLPGLVPIGNVVAEQGRIWLRTPQVAGPSLDDLLDAELGPADAVAVLRGVGRTLAGLHAHGLGHGLIDGESILLDRGGDPVLVTVEVEHAGPGVDLVAFAGLAWVLSRTWAARDPGAAELLQHCGDLAESAGLDTALSALPRSAGDAAARVAAAHRWGSSVNAVPPPRAAPDGIMGDRIRHSAAP